MERQAQETVTVALTRSEADALLRFAPNGVVPALLEAIDNPETDNHGYRLRSVWPGRVAANLHAMSKLERATRTELEVGDVWCCPVCGPVGAEHAE